VVTSDLYMNLCISLSLSEFPTKYVSIRYQVIYDFRVCDVPKPNYILQYFYNNFKTPRSGTRF